MEERKKVLLSDVERKVELLPFFNPDKKWKLNFGQYLSVIDTEITDLKDFVSLFRKDMLEFLKGTRLTITDEFGYTRDLVDVFREKCLDGESWI